MSLLDGLSGGLKWRCDYRYVIRCKSAFRIKKLDRTFRFGRTTSRGKGCDELSPAWTSTSREREAHSHARTQRVKD